MYFPNPNEKYDHVYAIVRLEVDGDESKSLDRNRISIKKIVRSMESAEREVDRLNQLNESKGYVYYWDLTRLERDPAALPSEVDTTAAHQTSEP